MKKGLVSNKRFEENDLDRDNILSDKSETFIGKYKSEKRNRKNSSSRLSNSINVNNSTHNNTSTFSNQNFVPTSNLNDLVASLEEKLNVYEQEIKNLVEEKIQMQITISNLTQNSKKIIHINNEDQVEMNNDYFTQMKKQIDAQKLLLQQEDSILDQTISNKLELTQQKETIIKEIKFLKDELNMLIDMHKNISQELHDKSSQLDLSENRKKEKSFLDSRSRNSDKKNCENNNNILSPRKSLNKSMNSLNISSISNENLPNIEQFFVYKNKFSLVDSEKNLWHMKKCKKFKHFTKENSDKYKTKEENLMAFLEFYQNNHKEKSNEIEISEGEEISIIKKENEQTVLGNNDNIDNSLDLCYSN